MTLTPRIRGIVYVVLVVAGILGGVGTALAPDVAGEAAAGAAGWIDTILAVVAVVAGVLARLNLTPAAPKAPELTDLERQADADAAGNDLEAWPYDGERVVYMALTEAETDAALEARGWLSQAHPGHPLLGVIDKML